MNDYKLFGYDPVLNASELYGHNFALNAPVSLNVELSNDTDNSYDMTSLEPVKNNVILVA